MRKDALRTYPWAAPSLAAAAFAAAAWLAAASPSIARVAIAPLVVAVTAISGLAAYGIARAANGRKVAALTASTPAALVAGAFGSFLLVDSSAGRAGLAAATVVLLAVYLAYLRGMVKGDGRFRAEDFSHLSFAAHVVTVFFVLTFAFGIAAYVRVPPPLAAFAVAATVLLATAETFRRAGLARGDLSTVVAAFVALGVQFFVALSFLPTLHLVNAAVGTVLFAAGIHAAVAALGERTPAPAYCRQFAFSLVLVALVLSTARWA